MGLPRTPGKQGSALKKGFKTPVKSASKPSAASSVPSKAKAKLRVDSSKKEGRGDDALNPHQHHESHSEQQQAGARRSGQIGLKQQRQEQQRKQERQEQRQQQQQQRRKPDSEDGAEQDDDDVAGDQPTSGGGGRSVPSSEDGGGSEDGGAGAARAATAAAGGGRRGGAGDGGVEALERGLEALKSDGGAAALLADEPELLALLNDMQGALAEVRGRVAPLLSEVAGGGLRTSEGLSYLEAKHLLLLQYCACLVVYVMLRAEGRKVKGHPVVTRLVQLRAYLERTRPIDKQLAYQIDKLLRPTSSGDAGAGGGGDAGTGTGVDGGGEDAPAAAAGGDEDALRYRPNPAALQTKAPLSGGLGGGEGGEGGEGAGGVYRPPRLNPVAMEEDLAASRQERRRAVEQKRRAKGSSLVRELAQELAGAPDEVEALLPGMDGAAAAATRRRLEARAAQEEELMMRVPLGKAEVKRLKAQRRAGLSSQGFLDGFEDEVADLVGMAAADGRGRGGSAKGRAAAPRQGPPLDDGFGFGGGGFEFETGAGQKRRAAGGPDELFSASKAARAAAGKGQKRRR